MKRLISVFLITMPLVFALSGLGSCKNDAGTDKITAPVIGTIEPATDAGGSVKVLEGESVTFTGINLDKIGSIVLGQHDRTGEITEHTSEKIVFTVPMLPELIDASPRTVTIKAYYTDGKLHMEKNYYITSNGTGFYAETAKTGDNATVGSTVTVLGRALTRATKITLTGTDIEHELDPADFTVKDDGSELTFAIPDADYAVGSSTATVTVFSADSEFVCKDQIRILIPSFEKMPAQGAPVVVGGEATIKGANLGVVSSVTYAGYTLDIRSNDGTTMVVIFPLKPAAHDPVIMTEDLVFHYGTPDRAVVVAEGFKFDSTYTDNTPQIASIISSNGDNRFFLNNEATITGTNIDYITKIRVGELDAAIKQGQSTTQVRFDVPQDYTFNTATILDVMMEYAGEFMKAGEIKVYPFFYFKGLKLGLHSNASGTACEDGETNSVAVLPHGKIYSSLELFGHNNVEPVVPDRFAWSRTTLAKVGTTGAMKSDGKLDPTVITGKADYYSVAPYIFACTNGSSQIRLTGSGSGSQSNYRYIRRMNSPTSFSQWINNDCYGASPVYFRVMMADSETDGKWQAAVAGGVLETVLEYDGMAATTGDLTIAYGSAGTGPADEAENKWKKGSVILAQYLTYEWSSGSTSVSEHTMGDVYQSGFIHVTDLSCVDADYLAFDTTRPNPDLAETDTNRTRRSGFIIFDLYWPKNAMNK